MLKNLNFVAFDFETTWLDVAKDEAIQVWIVSFDYKFDIKKQFSTYIKPDNFTSLSEIVEFTTWIKTKDIESAPSFQDIKKDLVDFFDENTVLIGHNIQFDISFMEKYLWKIPYLTTFDTYIYSRLLLHFQPSYALEILADKHGFKRNSHDALEDSLMSLDLFKLIMKQASKLIKKYPFLQDVLLKSDSVFTKIMDLEKINKHVFSIPKKPIHIPKSKKITSSKEIVTNYENKTVFNTTGVSMQDVINFGINWQTKVILAFSSRNRLNIWKSILKEKYIPYSWLSNGSISNQDNEKKLLSKKNFEDYEANYILKAFSHYQEDISVFDISNFDEYKIHNFLSWEKRGINSSFILTTHGEFFNYIKENGNDTIKDYKVLFFDWHLWMGSLWSVVNKGFDFYELLNKLEIIKYEKEFDNDEKYIDSLINDISTFFWGLSVKLLPFFKWTDNKIEMVNLFAETRNGLNQLQTSYEKLTEKIEKLWEKQITNYWSIFQECADNYCILEQKIFGNGNLKYIFNPLLQNIDINTFNDYMEGLTYYNFTTLEKQDYVKLNTILPEKEEKTKIIDYKEDIDFKKLVETIKEKMEENKKIFLVSNNKNFSNSLFKLIFNLFKEYDIKANIYAENITWWQWKLLYYLKKDREKKVVIWWPEFLIWNKSNFINYNEVFLLSINWKNRDNIINDIKFYI